METQRLFVHKYELLDRLLAPADLDEGRLIEASAILRLLLVDKLAESANVNTRLAIRYEVAMPPPRPTWSSENLPTPLLDARWHSLIPETAPEGWERKRLNLEKFVALPIVEARGVPIKVVELIKLVANSMGGIHSGPPRKEVLNAASIGSLDVFGIPAAPRAMFYVGAAASDALKPLNDELRQRS